MKKKNIEIRKHVFIHCVASCDHFIAFGMQLQEILSNQSCIAYAVRKLPTRAPQNGQEATHMRWSDRRDGEYLGGFGYVTSYSHRGPPSIPIGAHDRMCDRFNTLYPVYSPLPHLLRGYVWIPLLLPSFGVGRIDAQTVALTAILLPGTT